MAQHKQVSEQVTYEQADGVGIWSIEDMPKALESGELEKGEEHFRDVAAQDSMAASVVEVGNAESLSKDVLDHINEQWTALGEETGLDATAYVADGIGRLAISNKNEAEGMETKGFKDREAALEWASEF
ncbi:hypothetical protein [Halovenus sp. HT40]|uniref:hypothetical protein n=1 Tax=Halovenus sp. HT40 TaxID=3126691 RepID=UPI00300F6671